MTAPSTMPALGIAALTALPNPIEVELARTQDDTNSQAAETSTASSPAPSNELLLRQR